MNIVVEFVVVVFKIVWSFVVAGTKWFVRMREKSVVGQVCLITGAGSGLGRLFAKEFARRGATLVLWDINREGNEETAELVRDIHREISSKSGNILVLYLPDGLNFMLIIVYVNWATLASSCSVNIAA